MPFARPEQGNIDIQRWPVDEHDSPNPGQQSSACCRRPMRDRSASATFALGSRSTAWPDDLPGLIRSSSCAWGLPSMNSPRRGNPSGYTGGSDRISVLPCQEPCRGAARLLRAKVPLGAEAPPPAGPKGRDAAAATDVPEANLALFTFSRALAGCGSLEGSTLRPDNKEPIGTVQTELHAPPLHLYCIKRYRAPASSRQLLSVLNIKFPEKQIAARLAWAASN